MVLWFSWFIGGLAVTRLLSLKRVPEPELMDDDSEVEAYAGAAAQAYLEAIDRSFVQHVEGLISAPRIETARVLDVGCGPGQILVMMKQRWPGMQITGIDAGPAMIEKAREDATAAGVAITYEVLRVGPEGEARLPYDGASFDLVTCNSVIHHLADPVGALDEIARVVKPDGAVLVRDLQRPKLMLPYALHVRIFGRHYEGEMRRLYEASVAAAYTPKEFGELLARSKLASGRARVFTHGLTHAGIERAAMGGPGPRSTGLPTTSRS
jgi:ubiquinone/menaquinone biosynthesis C-methylase UbiE